MDDLDRELGSLFDAARGTTEPTSEDRTRIRAALAAKLASGALLTSASAQAAAGAGGASMGGFLGKGLKLVLLTQVGPGLLAGTLLGGGASLVASAVTETRTAPADTVVSAAQNTAGSPRSSERLPTVTTVSSGAEPLSSPAPVPSLRATAHSAAGSPVSASTSPPSTGSAIAAFPEPRPQPQTSELSSELAVVSRMHSAWQRGDWAGVRSAIQTHEQQFPRGTLTEEREAVKVMLACRSADPARAHELGSAFSSRHPGSTHAARVSAVCGAKR